MRHLGDRQQPAEHEREPERRDEGEEPRIERHADEVVALTEGPRGEHDRRRDPGGEREQPDQRGSTHGRVPGSRIDAAI